ncbi:hypothetical protein, partial [Rhodoferax sp.]|uniref:hypothetical protein n=1 Tax=Rhodoferax sp. TaxID=50421 RepID=UPI00374CF218
MKFFLGVNAALDLAAFNGLDDSGHTGEKVVFLFLALNAVIEETFNADYAVHQRALGSLTDLVTHEDANLVQLLPLAIQRQQRANLEIAGGNV